jgi:hypothetical protein
LTEQFGDNFKELNSAVKEMVVWQENYKSHIHQYEKSLENVIARVETLTEIRKEEKENIVGIIKALEESSKNVNDSMKESTSIVKESLQLLLREANGKLR